MTNGYLVIRKGVSGLCRNHRIAHSFKKSIERFLGKKNIVIVSRGFNVDYLRVFVEWSRISVYLTVL